MDIFCCCFFPHKFETHGHIVPMPNAHVKKINKWRIQRISRIVFLDFCSESCLSKVPRHFARKFWIEGYDPGFAATLRTWVWRVKTSRAVAVIREQDPSKQPWTFQWEKTVITLLWPKIKSRQEISTKKSYYCNKNERNRCALLTTMSQLANNECRF